MLFIKNKNVLILCILLVFCLFSCDLESLDSGGDGDNSAGPGKPAHADCELAGRTMVVYNTNSQDSLDVARYYLEKRNIPEENLVGITPSRTDYLSWEQYVSQVKDPLKIALNGLGKEHILYIVFTYETPYKISSFPDELQTTYLGKALDSYIADIWDTTGSLTGWKYSPYYDSSSSKNNFYREFLSLADYRESQNAKTVYSVWRLDAAGSELAKGLVDKAVSAEREGLAGKGYFDRRYGNISGVNDSSYGAGDWDVFRAAEFVSARGFEVVEDTNSAEFGTAPALAHCPGALFYGGWYSYNHYNDAFTWANGAIGVHLDSASAANPRGGNNWSANAVKNGITITSGAVGEPYLQGLPHVDGLFKDILNDGAHAGDAFFRNTAHVKWMIINIGDPLYRPFLPVL